MLFLEEDVWIGVRVILLSGAHVGKGAVTEANTLVNKEISTSVGRSCKDYSS